MYYCLLKLFNSILFFCAGMQADTFIDSAHSTNFQLNVIEQNGDLLVEDFVLRMYTGDSFGLPLSTSENFAMHMDTSTSDKSEAFSLSLSTGEFVGFDTKVTSYSNHVIFGRKTFILPRSII
jgi:hypothetical protein